VASGRGGSRWQVAPTWALIRLASRLCNLCLVTSTVMQSQLSEQGCRQLDVWKRGVDTNMFNPKFRSDAMRVCACASPGSIIWASRTHDVPLHRECSYLLHTDELHAAPSCAPGRRCAQRVGCGGGRNG
jgi:hypothetical protein